MRFLPWEVEKSIFLQIQTNWKEYIMFSHTKNGISDNTLLYVSIFPTLMISLTKNLLRMKSKKIISRVYKILFSSKKMSSKKRKARLK